MQKRHLAPSAALYAALLVVASIQTARASLPTPWGTVAEPALPGQVCATLPAQRSASGGRVDALDADPHQSQPDKAAIQAALNACPAGSAVKLVQGAAGQNAFISGPLQLLSGVTLWVDTGVTLFASRNPADYDNGLGTCGTATVANKKSCNPLLQATNTAHSGIVGGGTIDGRGGSVLTSGANAGLRSWWDVAWQNKSEGKYQQNPRLLQINGGSDFTLYGVAFVNAPNFHIVSNGVQGITAWNIKILTPTLAYSRPGYACPSGSTPDKTTPATCFTPETTKNTDGFDPGLSSQVVLAYSYISTGDDNVAIKSSGKTGTSTRHLYAHNHFYYGHGMSIGSEVDSGVSQVLVDGLSIDGFDNNYGLRIKSDSSRGGVVQGISYQNICMRNVQYPITLDYYYAKVQGKDQGQGRLPPQFDNIRIRNLLSLGSNKLGAGQLVLSGSAEHPIDLWLDNVVLQGSSLSFAKAHNGGASSPAHLQVHADGGAVSFWPLLQSAASNPSNSNNGVVLNGTPGASQPLDCSTAFPPYSSVREDSPI